MKFDHRHVYSSSYMQYNEAGVPAAHSADHPASHPNSM